MIENYMVYNFMTNVVGIISIGLGGYIVFCIVETLRNILRNK